MDFKTILFEIKEGVAELTLNRPPLNIINIAMMHEINSALKHLNAQKELKLLVVRGAGKAFSAGVDVGEHTKDKVGEMIKTFHRVFLNLDQLEIPTFSVVQGAALGGGCELAGFCDMVLASEEAKFAQPEIKVGVFPPVAIAYFCNFMSPKRVLELAITGDVLTAKEALAAGLVNKLCPRDGLENEAKNYAEKIRGQSAAVLRLTKKSWKECNRINFQEALKSTEKIYLDDLMTTRDVHEGLAAFLEKRMPVWENR